MCKCFSQENLNKNFFFYFINFRSQSSSNNSTDINRNNKISSEYLAVHCSGGCGRTGTIIAIDQLWTLLENNVKI